MCDARSEGLCPLGAHHAQLLFSYTITKQADDVTLARRTHGKHVLLEQGRKPALEVRVKRGDGWRLDGNKPHVEHLEPTTLKTLG